MAQIIKEYRSLEQYQQTVHFNPDALKPDQCDHCGCEHLWCNGQYERAISGRDKNKTKAEAIDILRFKCSRCRIHYSVLPSIVSLLRWYLWCMQQWVLLMVLNGYSFCKASQIAGIDRRTVARWYAWLQDKFQMIYQLVCHLDSRFIHHNTLNDFYLSLFIFHSLSRLAAVLHQNKILVPYLLAVNSQQDGGN